MKQVTDKQQLFRYIQQLDFAIVDVGLYLDTHPCDQEALAYYTEYKQLLKQATDEYTLYYGPMSIENVDVDKEWTWVQDPWPWEGVL